MTVIRYVPPDPTDLVMQGEQLRLTAIAGGVHAAPAPIAMMPMLSGVADACVACAPKLVAGEQSYAPMAGAYPSPTRDVLPDPFAGTLIRANAVICGRNGEIIPIPLGQRLMDSFVESTQRWVIAGVTRDSAGAALGNCAVIAFETGRLTKDGTPVVAQTISDGSGNYSVDVPMNTLYELTAYLVGSPDRAGVTINTVTPTANG